MWRYDPPEDDTYIGNIWGWKFSLFGAVLLFGLIALAFVRAHQTGTSVWDAMREPPPPRDTLAPGERPTPEQLLEDAGFDPNDG